MILSFFVEKQGGNATSLVERQSARICASFFMGLRLFLSFSTEHFVQEPSADTVSGNAVHGVFVEFPVLFLECFGFLIHLTKFWIV